MAKRNKYSVEIIFDFPIDDKEKMDKIEDVCKQMIVVKYQSAYIELSDEQKEVGFEILQRKFKEEYGEKYSIGIIEK